MIVQYEISIKFQPQSWDLKHSKVKIIMIISNKIHSKELF